MSFNILLPPPSPPLSFFVAQVGKQRLRLNLMLPAGNVGWSFSLEEWHHFLPTVGFGVQGSAALKDAGLPRIWQP